VARVLDRRARGLFLNAATGPAIAEPVQQRTRRFVGRFHDAAPVVAALVGAWVLWSQYSGLSRLSRQYDNPRSLQADTQSTADYDLVTLPWKRATPGVFDVTAGSMTLVTGEEPYAYEVFATVNTNGANTAYIEFSGELQGGGATIGLQQAGKWIAVSSVLTPGAFSDSNSALLGYNRSVTVVIANNNAAGRSRLLIKSLQLFLRQ